MMSLSVEDEELGIDVSPEVRAATAPDAELAGVELAPGTGHRLHGADGDCLQVEAEIEVRGAASVGLTLCRSPDGEEQTIVAWHRDEQVLRLYRTRSSLNPEAGRGVHDAPLAPAPGEPLTLTVFLHRSVVEAFANRRAPWSDASTPPGRTAAAWRCSPPTALTSAAAASGAAPRSGECEACQRAGWHPRHSSTMYG